jgi:chaperonin GroES
VLFQLLGMLIEAGKEVASVKDVLTGEQKDANIPATTTLALIEQGLKVFSSIYKRIYRALGVEFNKLRELNRKYLPTQVDFKQGDEWRSITNDVYRQGGGVEPVADPTMVTDMQRLGRAQFLLQFRNDPSIDGDVILKRVLIGANIERIDELFRPVPAVPPDIAAKGLEIELKAERIRSEGVKDMAQAIYFLAQAAKAASDSDLGWYESQMDFLMRKLEANSGSGSEKTPPAGPAKGGPGAGPPTMASPSGHESLPPIPQRLPGGAAPGPVGPPGGGQPG